ncbi:RWD-domain-containing protein [Violaceomyces palustris]|uniref:RWD-domain-containing protein n=1 Tax=Violaceomyces palustris TaxID=1673888 RepID=A0ACD0NSW4_9BASI|nr:RWD-domain-containing protein [Violaceomyces palustris]
MSISNEEHDQILQEELEVLESIYVDELEKVSKDELKIRIQPEEDILPESSPSVTLSLNIKYTQDYPEEPPEMRIEVIEDQDSILGGIGEDEEGTDQPADDRAQREGIVELTKGLDEVAQESLGMAMVFTLASHLRESLTGYIQKILDERAAAESARREAEIEVEAEKFRGTAVTPERFHEWAVRFEAERKLEKEKAEEEKMARMSNKEREEYKRMKTKPSGRQLFERGGDEFVDDGAGEGDGEEEEVDWRMFSREERERERREEDERRRLEEETQRFNLDDDDEDDS